MEQKKFQIVNIGTSLILVVFIILAMLTFSMLALLRAQSDYQGTELTAQHTKQYYTATNEGERFLARVDAFLLDVANQTEEFEKALEQLALEPNVTVTTAEQKAVITNHIFINDNQELYIELAVTPPLDTEENRVVISAWRQQSSKNWKAENSVVLIQ